MTSRTAEDRDTLGLMAHNLNHHALRSAVDFFKLMRLKYPGVKTQEELIQQIHGDDPMETSELKRILTEADYKW